MYFMVFEWVTGSVLPSTPARPEHCWIMGRMLARIHSLKLDFPEVNIPRQVANFNWKPLLVRGREISAPWADADFTLSELLEWTSSYEAAHDALSRHQVFRHCDLDQKNVLWPEERSQCLIDWESAGPHGYLDEGGAVKEDWRAAINGGLVGQLEWLEYNMRRSLGEAVSEPGDQETGTLESVRTLISLREITRNREIWCKWLEEGI